MDNQRRVVACAENECIAAYMCSKKQELAEKPERISENVYMSLSKSYSNICDAKTLKTSLRSRGWENGSKDLCNGSLRLVQAVLKVGTKRGEQ